MEVIANIKIVAMLLFIVMYTGVVHSHYMRNCNTIREGMRRCYQHIEHDAYVTARGTYIMHCTRNVAACGTRAVLLAEIFSNSNAAYLQCNVVIITLHDPGYHGKWTYKIRRRIEFCDWYHSMRETAVDVAWN